MTNQAFLNEYLDFIQHGDEISEELIESIMTRATSANIDKIQKAYAKNLKNIKAFLKDHGVSLSYIESQGKKAALVARQQYKRNIPADKVAIKIIASIGKETLRTVLKGHKSAIDTPIEDAPEDSLGEKILKSIGIFCIVLFVNTFLSVLAGIFLASAGLPINFVGAVTAIVIAPLVEEYAKKVSIEGKYQWVYTGIFAGLEGLMYVVRMMAAGGGLPQVLILRIAAMGMHFGTTAIQSHFQKKAIETGDNSKALTGYMIAVGCHATWNFIGILFNDEFLQFVGI